MACIAVIAAGPGAATSPERNLSEQGLAALTPGIDRLPGRLRTCASLSRHRGCDLVDF
jgi:hypothetical protein